ncbi:conjugative transposon protein TraK [Pedobacter chitinilyticus]|uniref:Conjugative transposon protein TraK n=1 Tax=Pedobacter chitinilyticus TaxID=2233776 RepID=A0A443YVV6_9SPHI|nr:conjugative transposon protein TraK [Pedobacter chitinilyticus]RWU08129.1 conjugative transposon protein TraK [Pedobacter chitinilyticus]
MFKKAKNIDTAFRHIRAFSLVAIIASCTICGLAIFKSLDFVAKMQQKIYVLAGGKALEALASDRRENVPVEARDHVRTFHQLFFNLDPDDKVIRESIGRALYLADASAKREYDNLKEKGYYNNIISGNVSQILRIDSVVVNLESHPYLFRCIGKLEITRSTSIVLRSLVTEGELRNVNRSDNNPHGFLIENWKVIENNDMDIKQRQP